MLMLIINEKVEEKKELFWYWEVARFGFVVQWLPLAHISVTQILTVPMIK